LKKLKFLVEKYLYLRNGRLLSTNEPEREAAAERD